MYSMIHRFMSWNCQRIKINSMYPRLPSRKITFSRSSSLSAGDGVVGNNDQPAGSVTSSTTHSPLPSNTERRITPSEALMAGRFAVRAVAGESGRAQRCGRVQGDGDREIGPLESSSPPTRTQPPPTPPSHLPRPRAIPSYSSSRARSAMTPPRTTSTLEEDNISEEEIEMLSPPTAARKSRMAAIFVQDSSSSQASTSTSSGMSSQSSVIAIDTSPLPPTRPIMKVIHPTIPSSTLGKKQATVRSFTTSTKISYSKSRVNNEEVSAMPDVPERLLDDLEALSMAEDLSSHGGGGSGVTERAGRVLNRRSVNQPTSRPSSIIARLKTSRPATSTTTSTLPPFSINTFSSPHFTHSRPTIVYTSSSHEATELLSCLRGGIYGFDLEWPVWRGTSSTKTKNGKSREWTNPGKTALVQICDEKMVLLLHISKMDVFPTKLREFCEDRSIIKLGVQVRGDGQKLSRDFDDLLPNGLLDLSHLARRVDPLGCGPGNQLISLANLTKAYLGRELDKGDVRMSDWSRDLDQKQIDYAANDVYASYLIYKRLLVIAEERGLPLDDLHSSASHLRQEHSQYNELIQPKPSCDEDDDNAPSPTRAAAVSSSVIRAFVLFSMGKDVDEIGKAMRTADNPLAKSTVKSYIVDAITKDASLGYDKRRMYSLLNDGSFLSRSGHKIRRMLALELGEEPEATLSDDVNSGRE